jgi:hypothetical protein
MLSEEDLNLRRNLAYLSPTAARDSYEQAYRDCRLIADQLPTYSGTFSFDIPNPATYGSSHIKRAGFAWDEGFSFPSLDPASSSESMNGLRQRVVGGARVRTSSRIPAQSTMRPSQGRSVAKGGTVRFDRLLVLTSLIVFACLWAFTAQPAVGQLSASGLDQFGTFQRNHIQSMNVYNLNNHLEIPVFEKKERGVSFSAMIVGDFLDSLVITPNCNPGCPPGSHFQQGALVPSNITNVSAAYHTLGLQSCTSAYPDQAVIVYPDSIRDQQSTVHQILQGSYSVMMGEGCSAGTYSAPS